MKFPESWLREHVGVTASREELATCLTAIGLEVEGIEVIGAELNGVVVAEIIATAKHPEADRLQVCQVSIGNGETVQIVCGAPNARAGLKAPLATVGATLPGGLAIGAAKLRGVESFGMLCSAKELAIDPDASGLLELPVDAPVGAPLASYLGLPDASFELKLTPNRGDCFSVRGIAFDVAAALGSQVNALEIPEAKITSQAAFEVVLAAGADCPRYCGRVIEGLNAGTKSPLWLTEKLKRAGLRSISPLVDITAFVMLELGQPMHAYDADTLIGPICVRAATSAETCHLLDERNVTLDSGFFVIDNAGKAIGLAGIMGGFATRVTEKTTRVFLEAAHFVPSAIIGRGRKLGLHTDAAHRFERGVDPQLPRFAIERATALVQQIMGGQAGPITETTLHVGLSPTKNVILRRARLARVLGLDIADSEVSRILRALGMCVSEVNEGWQVTPPTRRFDIAIEEDLIEEIARIHGYDAIPVRLPAGEISLSAPSETVVPDAVLRRQLAAHDFLEVINYAFVDAGLLAQWHVDANAVVLANPLASDMGAMRTSLLPGLIQALQHNRSRQQERIRLFEIGRVFHKVDGSAPIETRRLAAIAMGRADAEQWAVPSRDVDFYDLKAEVEQLLALAGASAEFRMADLPYGHPGKSATVWRAGVLIGWVGHLHPRLARELDLEGEVVGFELDIAPLVCRDVPRSQALSKFPSIRRDLALVVSEEMPWARIEKCIRDSLGERLQQVRLFDVYRGTGQSGTSLGGVGLGTGTKSIAMGLILQDVSRTLADTDADQAINDALQALDRECSAKLRT